MFRGDNSIQAMAAALRFRQWIEYEIAFVEAHAKKKK